MKRYQEYVGRRVMKMKLVGKRKRGKEGGQRENLWM